MYKAKDIANYVIAKCIKDNKPITNLYLQKILYYTQRQYLKNNNVAFQEDFEAWAFGPVIPEIYYKYCGYGAEPITISSEYSIPNNDDRVIIDQIVEQKRILQPWDMVDDVHRENGAWYKIYNNGAGDHYTIEKELIKNIG